MSLPILEILTTKAKASVASRSILQDFLGSVKALAGLELECVYSIPIWLETKKKFF